MGYTVHGILQARMLERAAFPFSRGSSQPRDQTQISRNAGRFFTAEPQGKPKNIGVGHLSLLQRIFLTQELNWGLLQCRWILYNWTIREAQKENYSAIKKKEWNNVICRNMDGTRDYHIKWSKSEGERLIPYDITYMWNLKNDINEPIYETETESGTQRIGSWLPRDWGWEREVLGVWD